MENTTLLRHHFPNDCRRLILITSVRILPKLKIHKYIHTQTNINGVKINCTSPSTSLPLSGWLWSQRSKQHLQRGEVAIFCLPQRLSTTGSVSAIQRGHWTNTQVKRLCVEVKRMPPLPSATRGSASMVRAIPHHQVAPVQRWWMKMETDRLEWSGTRRRSRTAWGTFPSGNNKAVGIKTGKDKKAKDIKPIDGFKGKRGKTHVYGIQL